MDPELCGLTTVEPIKSSPCQQNEALALVVLGEVQSQPNEHEGPQKQRLGEARDMVARGPKLS